MMEDPEYYGTETTWKIGDLSIEVEGEAWMTFEGKELRTPGDFLMEFRGQEIPRDVTPDVGDWQNNKWFTVYDTTEIDHADAPIFYTLSEAIGYAVDRAKGE